MLVSIQDVAEKAGVSPGTVSSALNARKEARIAPATQERIRRIAAEMGYQPNAVARSLRRRSTNIIGLYTNFGLSDTRKPFYSEVISGLEAGCEEYGKDLLIHTAARRRSPDEIYAELAGGQVAGLVLLFPPCGDKREEALLIQRLTRSQLPVVALADALPQIPSVVVDDAGGSRLLAKHLARRGYRTISYLMGPETLSLVTRRFQAFCSAATSLGMTVVPTYNHSEYSELSSLVTRLAPGGRALRGPTAAVCWYDEVAFRLLDECRRQGVRVPQDLAIAGFDGIPSLELPAQRLTTVRAPWTDVARTAITLLSSRMMGKEVSLETVLPVTLIEGNTA